MRRKHSFVGLIAVVFIVAVIFGVHVLSFNALRNLNLGAYLFPLGVVALGITFFHLHKFKQGRRLLTVANEADIVSRDGLHWHPEISIYVKGVKQEIPQIGITDMDMSKLHAMHQKMQARHMHDGPNEQGIVHLKFEGLVQKSDITLGRFFEKWGKDIHSLGAAVKMTVNGTDNTELESYVMQDKDKIELRYE